MSLQQQMSDLRIVLLGKSMSDNRHVANFILERDGPESKTSVTMKLQQCSQRIEGRLNHRYVMLINSPQLLQPNLSLHQITQTVRECVSLSDPGPHVFIIVLHLKDFTDEDRYRVKGVLKEFSEEAIKRTIVLTTDDKTHGSVFSYFSKNTAVNLLIAECGGGHLQLNEKKTGWRSDILKRVEEILKGKKETYLTCTIYEDVKRTSEDKEEKKSEEENYESSYEKDLKEISHEESTHASGQQKLNLVLCGSNATHTVSVSKLLCHSSQTDGTEECVKKQKSHGRQISLVNLPALSRLSEEEVMHHTLRCVSLSDPGVHAFLIIVPVGPLTVEDKAEIEKILKIFDSRDHVILLFTKKPTDDGIATDLVDIYPDCQELISLCGSQYRVIGLKEHEESRQIPELLEYIEKMETEPYSPQICVEAQENRVRRELEEKHKKEIEQLESKIKELESKIPSEGGVFLLCSYEIT
nr:GTPase IMAP family member 8-like [Danio rerio]|eukprot:XP_021327765.1 GTPase IMAP family member 8-like [Danio rerio]